MKQIEEGVCFASDVPFLCFSLVMLDGRAFSFFLVSC